MVRGVVAGGGKPHPMPASRAPLSQALAGAGRHLAACAFDLRLGSHVFPSEMGGISPWPISHCVVLMARSEVGRGSGGRGGGSGGSRDRGGLRALAGSPVGLECLPGLKSTTANLRTGQFNVFARLEVRKKTWPYDASQKHARRAAANDGCCVSAKECNLPAIVKSCSA